jgi:hypothetical protein
MAPSYDLYNTGGDLRRADKSTKSNRRGKLQTARLQQRQQVDSDRGQNTGT